MGKPNIQNFDYKNRHKISSDLWNRLFHNGALSVVPLELSCPRELKQVQDVSCDIHGNGKRQWLQKPITRNSFGYLGLDGWKTLKYYLSYIKTYRLSNVAHRNI